MARNNNLHAAKTAKNDEFYTRWEDIQAELCGDISTMNPGYKEHFRGKTVLCNCDDPEWSNFWKFFRTKFDSWGLKKLISTHYEEGKSSYKLEYDAEGTRKTELAGDGDFRSDEGLAILREADIVCTNPPFSLFRDYVRVLVEAEKKFLIIGNMNAVTYKEIFPLIKDNKIWLGYSANKTMEFEVPEYYTFEKRSANGRGVVKVPSITWFTNLDIPKRHEHFESCWKYYGEEGEENRARGLYPTYDNYDAINIDKCKEIPGDYYGVMGVPITFLDKYNPDEFEIVAFRKGEDGQDLVFTREREREFNRTFVSLSDGEIRANYGSKAHDLLRWKESICESGNSSEAVKEPIDLFFPMTMRGCAEPYLDLNICLKANREELKSRQVMFNGHICQKTYHRLFVRRK